MYPSKCRHFQPRFYCTAVKKEEVRYTAQQSAKAHRGGVEI